MANKRLLKEVKLIDKELENYENIISVLKPINEDNLLQWEALIHGPSATPYFNHTFKLNINLPQDYPLKPPTIEFSPYRMPHCNVDFKTGEICLNILNSDNWSPVWNLLYVMMAIYQLLSDPVTDSPLNIDISNILRNNDIKAYNGLIAYYLHESK